MKKTYDVVSLIIVATISLIFIVIVLGSCTSTSSPSVTTPVEAETSAAPIINETTATTDITTTAETTEVTNDSTKSADGTTGEQDPIWTPFY